MECENIYGGILKYDGFNCWCRECQMPLMIQDLITMNGYNVKRCPCCHQRVRMRGRYKVNKAKLKRARMERLRMRKSLV